MFDYVAKHKRLLQIVLVIVIIPFAFFGLESYTRSVGGASDVATVEGGGITQREFGEALRRQQDQLREILGRSVEPEALDSPELRARVLDGLIAERLLAAEAAGGGLMLSKEAVIAELRRAPEFQSGGKFSPERYAAYLRLQGLSDEGNVALLQARLPVARLLASVSGTSIQSRALAERLLALEGQRREVSEARFAPEDYAAQVQADEAQLRRWFEANRARFRLPERVRAEYLVLSAGELARAESASEEEIRNAYEARAAQLATAEQRRASHILLETREAAQKVLAQARRSPERFAELAKQHSQDPGSAAVGGDLGMNAKGSLASPKLEEAIFRLRPGELSEVVETEFGFHVVRLAKVRSGSARPLDELRAELAAEIVKQKGARRFAEAAEAFSNLVYEQSDSLAPAAARFKLKPQASGWIARGAPAAGPFAHPKLLAAILSSDAVQQRRNTDAIEVAPGVLAAARVLEHRPAAERSFEEARPEVEQAFRGEEAGRLAREDGAAKLARLAKGGEAGVRWGPSKAASRRDPQGLPEAALQRIMALPAAKLPGYAGLERGAQGYVLYRVARVLPAQARPDAEKAEEIDRIAREAGERQLQAYLAALRARGKVEINRANLEKKQ